MATQTTDQNFTKVSDAGNIIKKTYNSLADSLEAILKGRRREEHTVADGGKVAINDGSRLESRVATVIAVESGEAAVVLLDADNDAVSILTQTGTSFGTTEDNDTTTNIYYDSGNTQFELNNEEGASRDYVITYEGQST